MDIICLEKVKNILDYHLNISKEYIHIYDEIHLESLKKLKQNLFNNILNHIDLLNTDEYVEDFLDIEEKLFYLKSEDFEKDLKNFFESKEFKELQKLEEISWYHKLEVLLTNINLALLDKEINDQYLNDLYNLKFLIKDNLNPNENLETNSKFNISLRKLIESCLKNEIQKEYEYFEINLVLIDILKKLYEIKSKTLLKDKY